MPFPMRGAIGLVLAMAMHSVSLGAQNIVGEVRAREGSRPLDGALITVLSQTGALKIEHVETPPRVTFKEVPAAELQAPRICSGR